MPHHYFITCASEQKAGELEKALVEFEANNSGKGTGGPYRSFESIKNRVIYQNAYSTGSVSQEACAQIELVTREKIAEDFFGEEWKLRELIDDNPREVHRTVYFFYLTDLKESYGGSKNENKPYSEKFKAGILEIIRNPVNVEFRDEEQHCRELLEKNLQVMRDIRENIKNNYSKKVEPVDFKEPEYPLVKLFAPLGFMCKCEAQGPVEAIVSFYAALKSGLENSWLLRRKWKIDDKDQGLKFY